VIKEFLNTDGASKDLSGKVARFVDSPCSVRMCTPVARHIYLLRQYVYYTYSEWKEHNEGNDVILVLCTTTRTCVCTFLARKFTTIIFFFFPRRRYKWYYLWITRKA